MAAMLVSSGTDIREIQEILGHASILSTQVYTKLPIQKGRARVFGDASAIKLPIKKRCRSAGISPALHFPTRSLAIQVASDADLRRRSARCRRS